MIKIDGMEALYRAHHGWVLYRRSHGHDRYVIHKLNPHDGSTYEGKYFLSLEEAAEEFDKLTSPKAEVFITMEGGIIQDISVENRYADADVFTVYVSEDDWIEEQPVLVNEDGSKVQVVRNGQYDVTQEEWDNLSHLL